MFSKDENARYQRRVVAPSAVRTTGELGREHTVRAKPEAVSLGSGTIKRSVGVQQIVIDSADRDQTVYPLPTNFTMRLPETLKNVFAIRLLKTEYYDSTQAMVVDGATVDVSSSVPYSTGFYLNLNDYRLLWRDTKKDSVGIFARLAAGTEIFPQNDNLFKDPYTYICNPIEPKFDRLDVKLYDSNNTVSTRTDIRYVVVLAVYSLPS